MVNRRPPNILVTGTPGTGKSTLCEQLAQVTGFRHIDVSQMAKANELCDGYDEQLDSLVIDEDKVCDALEDETAKGKCIVDYHSCDFFPERWFDLVVVLQTDNSVLYQRLQKRGYSDLKIRENVTCEIMQVLVEEARESYKEDIIKVVQNDSVEELEMNVENIRQWIISQCQ
ncbi:hypothetical protein BSKO_07513 [Bryopsis sp. KO-2023]|nr:hypothetical protein BSKO_07513 [Bryopsis sp. KO-2023]